MCLLKILAPASTRNDSKTGRHFRPEWQEQYPWIEYSDSKVFCSICKKCHDMKHFKFATKRENAFTVTGFVNWKHATETFKTHQLSSAHREAILKVSSSNSGCNVARQLNDTHNSEMLLARAALMTIVTSVQYLCRQGLGLRGHIEQESNLLQLLKVRSEDNAQLKSWLQRSSYKWVSPAIQNEIIELMARQVLRLLQTDVQKNEFYSVMVDETTDISVTEQVSFCFRFVDNMLKVHEYFMGFYQTASTTAETLRKTIEDVLIRFQLDINKCRGQCYDGASNMSGHISGLQTLLLTSPSHICCCYFVYVNVCYNFYCKLGCILLRRDLKDWGLKEELAIDRCQ
jgi:hypothetical protein